jgi:hypothetical protein
VIPIVNAGFLEILLTKTMATLDALGALDAFGGHDRYGRSLGRLER